MSSLSLGHLQALVEQRGAALRVRQVLQPVGGVGDKIYPPQYAVAENGLRYAGETRRIDGEDIPCVLLDSVASQANRIEAALYAAWENEDLHFPVMGVDFSEEKDLADLGTITTLHAPHRIADAILRDATDVEGTLLFRDLPEGRAFSAATNKNATALYLLCPTALIFGVWDSHGPRGAFGTSFERALSSEVIAVGARAGRSVSSRIDPLEIPSSIAIYVAKGNDADWTVDVTQAKHEKGKPQLYGRRETDKKGRASLINHSFVAPSISDIAGGITCDHALHTVVLSLTVLRKLRFVRDLVDAPLPKEASLAARTSLAALALAGIVRQRAEGFALRSRCWLVPSAPLVFEIVTIDGGLETFTLSVAEADALVRDASAEARRHRLPWTRVPLRLRPAPKLTALVRKTRARGQGRELDEAP